MPIFTVGTKEGTSKVNARYAEETGDCLEFYDIDMPPLLSNGAAIKNPPKRLVGKFKEYENFYIDGEDK